MSSNKLFEHSSHYGRTSYINDTKFEDMSNSLDIHKTIYHFKVILLGNIAVGKTCLISRFVENKFETNHKCNINLEFKCKKMPIDQSTVADLKIWDTCGDEKYRGLTKQYYKEAKGIILVYDVTNRNTFEQLEIWLEDINNYADKNVSVFLVGNKSDMANQRKVTLAEANGFAQIHQLSFLEVSAKNGNNVSLVFDRLVNLLAKKEKEQDIDVKRDKKKNAKRFKPSTQLNIDRPSQKGCC